MRDGDGGFHVILMRSHVSYILYPPPGFLFLSASAVTVSYRTISCGVLAEPPEHKRETEKHALGATVEARRKEARSR